MGTKEKRKGSHELCRGGGEESESVDMGTTRTPYVSSGSASATHSQQTGIFLPPRSRGPLDMYITSEARQTTLNTPFKKEERRQASRALARWFYTSVIPFNAENNEYYVNPMKLVFNSGPGFDAPTSHEYRTWMLKEEVDNVQSTWFLKSVDASASIKNGDLLYGYLDDVIQEIGEENVVQVISDNASNYKNAGAKLMEKKEKVWWTPCTAHCIDLMLEDISKMAWFDDTLKHAKCISKYLYRHQWVLVLMRKYTSNSEILRPAVTMRNGLFACMDRMLGKGKEREDADVQLDLFTNSASGCERNWSTFSMIHTKRKNRLEHKRLNALAYVKYNLALQQRSKKRMEKYDPIVVEEIASDDEWITEIEDPVLPEDPTWLEDELLYNVKAVRNVPPPVYEGDLYIREPRESSPPPPPREPTQPRSPITYKRKRGNEESSSRTRINVEYDSEDSFNEMMTYPTSSSRVGNEEDDVAFYLDEEDLDK
ncbi:hypothetical protein D8674_018249 [Pyrus ussuriensis x Pyrus communis]|uniref:DUF659 domain-containing protein n=1 Tax=Pyrus ussuriensis x Pyrus communis TaxID=2448454 RepID=A0A5N5G4W5_9ROSA|nr:hypothetical protein D8674_018249 [Pyrus ussuriensis x Pyrus communis]